MRFFVIIEIIARFVMELGMTVREGINLHPLSRWMRTFSGTLRLLFPKHDDVLWFFERRNFSRENNFKLIRCHGGLLFDLVRHKGSGVFKIRRELSVVFCSILVKAD